MGTYRMTDKDNVEVAAFDAIHNGEAILRANEIDEREGLTGTTRLWIKQDDGYWYAIQ